MVSREFISLESPAARRNTTGFNPCHGVLVHDPSSGSPKAPMIATHYNVDFSEHYLGPLMVKRGIDFLGWNTRYRGNEAFFVLEHALTDIGIGVCLLRERGYERFVILRNSGGGSLMGAYQSQAVEPNIAPAYGGRLPEEVTQLEAADLYISLNAHLGRPEVLTVWFAPSVVDESDPFAADPELDFYQQALPLDPAFVAWYREAQVARNRRITQWGVTELESSWELGFRDRALNLYRTWADPRMVDGTLDPSDWHLLPGGFEASQLLTGRDRSHQHAAHLALNVEPRRVPVPRSATPSTDHDTGSATPVHGRHRRVPKRCGAIFEALGSTSKEKVFFADDHYLADPADACSDVADRIAAWVSKN